MLVLAVFAEEALRVFGTRYAVVAGMLLVLLAIGYVPLVPKLHYIAVARATGHIPRAAALMTVSGVMEVVAAVLGGKYDGLDGLTLALVGVFMLEGLVTAPPVVRTAVTRGRHRLGDRLSGVSVQASLNLLWVRQILRLQLFTSRRTSSELTGPVDKKKVWRCF